MSGKEAVLKQLRIGQLKITSPAAQSTNVLCNNEEDELAFHRVHASSCACAGGAAGYL